MFDWFTTIPGLLVICGIVLLIIAVILFILGNKKEKKGTVATDNVNNVTPSNESITNNEVSTVEPITVDKIEEVPSVIDFTPISEPVSDTNDIDLSIDNNPNTDIDLSIGSNPVEADLGLEVGNESANNISTEPILTAVEQAEPVSIYGGNDPLINTEISETISDAVPYGGEPEIKTVEPVIEPVTETPVEMPTISIPDAIVSPVAEEEVSETVEPVIPEPVVLEEIKIEEPKVVEIEPVAPSVEQPIDLGIPSAPVMEEQPNLEEPSIDLQPAEVKIEEINIENN